MNYKPDTRYIFSDGEFVAQKPVTATRRSNKGFVLEGVATKYSTNLFNDSRGFINIMPGAFDISLKYPEAPIECWLDHNSKLALTGCRVELFSDEEAFNFRVHLDDTEISSQARALVECGAYEQVSLGWHSSKTVTKNFDGTDVAFILQGTLTHIALVPAGAIKTTHAQVSELKNCRSLREDVESKKFCSDNAFTELRRKLTALEKI